LYEIDGFVTEQTTNVETSKTITGLMLRVISLSLWLWQIIPLLPILGDPGAVSGGWKKSKRARKNSGEKKSRWYSFLTFLCPNFFSPV